MAIASFFSSHLSRQLLTFAGLLALTLATAACGDSEPDQRKAFDAQFQIATIVQTQLNNPTKAIIEFRKVAANWPNSHLADAALLKAMTNPSPLIAALVEAPLPAVGGSAGAACGRVKRWIA